MSFSTNPHLQYHAPGSKEDIELNKSAITNFKPVKQFALKSENVFDYCTALKNASIQFGYYGILTRIATDGTIAAPADGGVEDPTDVTLSNFTNMKLREIVFIVNTSYAMKPYQIYMPISWGFIGM